jgi:hypothetical protein
MSTTTQFPAAPSPARESARRKAHAEAQIVRWSVVAALATLGIVLGWRYTHAPAEPVVRYQTAHVDHGAIATKDDAVRLPNAALRFKPDVATVAAMAIGASAAPALAKEQLAADQRVVWVVRGGHPLPAVVRLGISDGMVTEVAEGDVHSGDSVVTEAVVAAGSRR